MTTPYNRGRVPDPSTDQVRVHFVNSLGVEVKVAFGAEEQEMAPL